MSDLYCSSVCLRPHCLPAVKPHLFTLNTLRGLAAEDEEEEDEGVPREESDAAEAPEDEKGEEEEKDDELAEYGLENYDDEDTGEEGEGAICSFE